MPKEAPSLAAPSPLSHGPSARAGAWRPYAIGAGAGLTAATSVRYFRRLYFARRMSKTHHASPPKTFESALEELEKIVDSMEAGQLPLEESIAAYRRGAQLLQYCQNALKEASQQVKILEAGILKDFSADGEPGVEDSPQ